MLLHFGSRLFNIVKSVGAPLLKDVIIPTVKQEAGKSILKRGTQRIMQGKGRTRKFVRKRKRDQNPSTALSMLTLLKSTNSPKQRRF